VLRYVYAAIATFDSARIDPQSRSMAMAMRTFDRLMLTVHVASAPTQREWDQWLDMCRKRAGLEARVIVENYGGGPNVVQRRALAEIVRGEDAMCAVLTDSGIERAALTALAWLGMSLRGYGVGQHRQAAEYLKLTPQELALALEVLPRLRQECGMQFADASNG
jgi:hypothetical protein